VIVTQFVQVGSPLQYPLDRSLYWLAFCIPVLATCLFVDYVMRSASEGFAKTVEQWMVELLFLPAAVGFGNVAFFTGLAMVIAYFSLAASLLFVVLSCFGFVLASLSIVRREQIWVLRWLVVSFPISIFVLVVFLFFLGPERGQLNDAWVLTYVPFF
jgi:hypothetical protein